MANRNAFEGTPEKFMVACFTHSGSGLVSETQSTLGSNLLKICLGSRKSIHQPQAPHQEWFPEISWPVAQQGHWEMRTGSVNQQPGQLQN